MDLSDLDAIKCPILRVKAIRKRGLEEAFKHVIDFFDDENTPLLSYQEKEKVLLDQFRTIYDVYFDE